MVYAFSCASYGCTWEVWRALKKPTSFPGSLFFLVAWLKTRHRNRNRNTVRVSYGGPEGSNANKKENANKKKKTQIKKNAN